MHISTFVLLVLIDVTLFDAILMLL